MYRTSTENSNGRRIERPFYITLIISNKNEETWKLIDDLSSRKYGRVRNISEIKVNNEPISSAAEMAEALNDFFFFFCQYWIKFGK